MPKKSGAHTKRLVSSPAPRLQPVFIEYAAASSAPGSFRMQSARSHISPPTLTVRESAVDAIPVPLEHTHSTDHHATVVSPALLQELAQVRAHLYGPMVACLINEFDGNLLALAPLINPSLAAHTRRFMEFGQDPALRPPSVRGIEINMCYADFSIGMHITREEFRRTLQRLMVPNTGVPQHYVLDWAIVCTRCGEAVTHYYADDLWNGRYIEHRRDPRCRTQELNLRAAQAGKSAKSAVHGVRGGRA